jgi:hypothetical protein
MIGSSSENNQTVGKSKLQGFKNFFGFVDEKLKEKVKKSKDSLNELYKYVKDKYKALKLGRISYDNECGKKLETALTDLKSLCDTEDGFSESGKGREFGKWMFNAYGSLSKIKDDWDGFLEGTALLLTLYANCSRTSAIPYSALGNAANICEKYYVYVESYCNVQSNMDEKELSQNENEMKNLIKFKPIEAQKELDNADKHVNSQMKRITLNKIEKNKKWEDTKKNILKKTKKIGKTVVNILTSPIWGTWEGIKLLKNKLGLGEELQNNKNKKMI